MAAHWIIDSHAHIIDPARFSFAHGPGYMPKQHERGTAEAYVATLDAHGVSQALLVQPSGYGTDNSAIFDAVATFPGRFKAIAVIDLAVPDRTLLEVFASIFKVTAPMRLMKAAPSPYSPASGRLGGLRRYSPTMRSGHASRHR
jgi:predicted TIM-barrel fold metal-dependent hydrolase